MDRLRVEITAIKKRPLWALKSRTVPFVAKIAGIGPEKSHFVFIFILSYYLHTFLPKMDFLLPDHLFEWPITRKRFIFE